MKSSKTIIIHVIMIIAALALVSCGGSGDVTGTTGGGGGGGGGGSATTSVSGKVALSSVVASGKPAIGAKSMFEMQNNALILQKAGNERGKQRPSLAPSGKPGTYSKALLKTINAAAPTSGSVVLSKANVEVYSADHPEWLYPIADAQTDHEGNFKVTKMSNADLNVPFGATYKDGDNIPSGKYTFIAYKYDINLGKLFVAVQAFVKNYEGVVSDNNLIAQDSDAVPSITSMFGLKPNSDGTYGGPSAKIPTNGAVQVIFSMAMARGSLVGDTINNVQKAINITNSTGIEVPGVWAVAADLLSLTFRPTNGFVAGETYNVFVQGGDKALNSGKNVFGRPLVESVSGSFVGDVYDNVSPNGGAILLKSQNAPISMPLRFWTDDPLDLNTFNVTSNLDIGDKPNAIFMGTYEYPPNPLQPLVLETVHVYEIEKALPLQLGGNYTVTVSGAKDLAGNTMNDITFSFTVESASQGIVPGSVDEFIQTQVKDVFGKWISAFDLGSLPGLTKHMTGDFYWLPERGGSDDLNRDGRVSLKEFTTMLSNLFGMFKECNMVVSGDVIGTISVSSTGVDPANPTAKDTADLAFTLDFDPQDKNNPMCGEMGDKMQLYLRLKNLNQAWMVTSGADYDASGVKLKDIAPIELVGPDDGELLDEPLGVSALPTFKWTGVANVSTYALIILDADDPWMERGWVAVSDGADTNEQQVTAKFATKTGQAGNIYILPKERMADQFGMWKTITALELGGNYIWSVVGFDTHTMKDFELGLIGGNTLFNDVVASAPARSFSVSGTKIALEVVVKDTILGKSYQFNEFIGGYDVSPWPEVDIEITTPTGPGTGQMSQYGFGSKNYNITFDSTGYVQNTVQLYNRQNWFQVCDGTYEWDPMANEQICTGPYTQFSIITNTGTPPVIDVTSVTDSDTITPMEMDLWGKIINATVKEIDVSGTVSDPGVTWVYLHVNGDNGKTGELVSPVVAGDFSFVNVPVFEGWNEVRLYGWGAEDYSYNFRVEVGPNGGTVYEPSVSFVINSNDATLVSTNYQSGDPYFLWNADPNDTAEVTTTSIIPGSNVYCDRWTSKGGVPQGYFDHFNIGDGITGDTFGEYYYIWNSGDGTETNVYATSAEYPLFEGLNYVRCWDSSGVFHDIEIYTTGGTQFILPITDVLVNTVSPASAFLRTLWSSTDSQELESSANTVNIEGNVLMSEVTDTITEDMRRIPIEYDGGTGDIINGLVIEHRAGSYSKAYFMNVPDVTDEASFSLDITLFKGYNYITVTTPTYERYYVNITTSGGIDPPQWVVIQSPIHNSTLPASVGTITYPIYGYIDDSIDGFDPAYLQARVYNYNTGANAYYYYGHPSVVPDTITYDSVNKYFYFSHSITGGQKYMIYVYARNCYTYGATPPYQCADPYGSVHQHQIYMNNDSGYSEYISKPGLAPGGGEPLP
jgi:hypothetical protein